MKPIWISIINITMAIQLTAALKCFVCDTNENPYCADPFNLHRIPLEECSLEKVRAAGPKWIGQLPHPSCTVIFGCQKITTCRSCSGGNEARIIRQCQIRETDHNNVCNLPRIQEQISLQMNQLSFCGYCEKNKCNNGTMLRYIGISAVSLIAVVTHFL